MSGAAGAGGSLDGGGSCWPRGDGGGARVGSGGCGTWAASARPERGEPWSPAKEERGPGRGVPTGRRTERRPPLRQSRGCTTTSSTGAGSERPIRTRPISTPKKSTLVSVRSLSQSRPRRNSSWNRGATQITTAASRPEAWTIICPSWLWSVASRRFSITMGRPLASAPSTLKAPVSTLTSRSSGVMSIPRVSLSRSMFWRNQGVRSGSCSPQNDLRSSRSRRPRPSRSISVLATRAPSDRPPMPGQLYRGPLGRRQTSQVVHTAALAPERSPLGKHGRVATRSRSLPVSTGTCWDPSPRLAATTARDPDGSPRSRTTSRRSGSTRAAARSRRQLPSAGTSRRSRSSVVHSSSVSPPARDQSSLDRSKAGRVRWGRAPRPSRRRRTPRGGPRGPRRPSRGLVVGEVEERGGSRPTPRPWNSRGERRAERPARGHGGRPGLDQGGQPLAEGPVADLVVVLGADRRTAPRASPAGSRPWRRSACGEYWPVIHPGRLEGLGQPTRVGEALVLAGALAGEHDVEGVVEVVAPHGVEPVAAASGDAAAAGRSGRSRRSATAGARAGRVHVLARQLLQEVDRQRS